VAQVKAANNSVNLTANTNGSSNTVTVPNMGYSDYNVYFVEQDTAGDLQTSVSAVNVNTV
jgi:hypothetical protein